MRNKDHGAAGRTGQIRNKDWGAAGGCEKLTKASGTDETASGREVEFTIKGQPFESENFTFQRVTLVLHPYGPFGREKNKRKKSWLQP